MTARVHLKRDAIERVIAERNLRQYKFARRAGIHCTLFVSLMTGGMHADPAIQVRIINVLGGTFADWSEVAEVPDVHLVRPARLWRSPGRDTSKRHRA